MAKSGGAAFVQVASAGSVIQALQAMVKAADADGEPGAPEAAAYESKSGGIVEVLEDLLDKANSQLSNARKSEESAMQNFAMLKQSLEDEIEFSTKDMEAAKTSSAASSEAKSE